MSEAIAHRTHIPEVRAPELPAVVRSLAWRFARHGWPTMLGTLLILCGVPTFLYIMTRIADPATASNLYDTGVALKRLFFILTIATLPTLVIFEALRVRPLYALPLTTRQIVHVQIGLGIVSVACLYLATVAYYRVVFGAPIPVVQPLLFLIPGTVILAGLGALLIDARWWKPFVVLAALGLLLYGSVTRFDDPSLDAAGAGWFTPTGTELLSLALLTAAGYVILRRTAVRDRQGETRSWAILEECFQRFLAWLQAQWPSRRSIIAMSSPVSAQFAFEWWTKGIVLSLLVTAFGALTLIWAWYEPRNWLESYRDTMPFLLMLAIAINGWIVGLMDGPDAKGTMDRFRATRPVSDWQLATLILRSGLFGTLVAMIITIALACLVYVYAGLFGFAPDRIWSRLDVTMIASLALLGWAGMGFNLSCTATGRHWIVMTAGLGGMSLLLFAIVFSQQMTEEQWAQVVQVSTMVFAAVAIAATLLSFGQALSRRLIPRWSLPAGLVLSIVSAVLFYAAFESTSAAANNRAALVTAVIGLSALVALPLASVPLAIAWNRHR